MLRLHAAHCLSCERDEQHRSQEGFGHALHQTDSGTHGVSTSSPCRTTAR